nr:retrovirus-related Pol polyprotein from transposon TNT 1-94 [Tanacetum cinerariifolium]
NDVIQTKKYAELSAAEKIQADCDMRATNIILQGLPADIYSPVNRHIVAKDLWERVQLLIQGTSLTKQEREYSSFVVPVFSPEDDLIAYLNKAMVFLTAVASSSTAYKGNATSSKGNTTSGHERVVKCYTCQGEGHMARQCTHPKQPRNTTWYKEKAMLAEAQEAGQIMEKEQLAFLADPGISAEKANKDQNNESITAKLERYKKRVKTFEQRLNIDLSCCEKMIDSQMDDMIKEKLALKEKLDSLE